MIEVTRELYQQNIPKCCSMKTIEEHEDAMLCWGLASCLEKGITMNCDNCDFKVEENS